MSQYVPDGSPSIPIERYEQLVEYFATASRPREAWKIGTEYENVAVQRADGRAASFFGSTGIERVLERLAAGFGWERVLEGDHVVALRRGTASITLEPGAQVELSGEPWSSVHEAADEFRRHVREIVAVGGDLGLAFLGLGMQPRSTLDEITWVPKQRYRIMGPYMQKVGRLGHRMMKQTASVQVNLDFDSEADGMAKMRVAMGLSPLLAAMFANSPVCDGDLNGYMTYRGHVWTDTDPQRSGLLRFLFSDRAGFADYVEYALDVPMYFIIRAGWIDMTAHTFREFFQNGVDGHRPTLTDWHHHLTTLFPEVRLKKYIEVRSFDSQAPELALAVPALMKGVLYGADTLAAAWDLVGGWSWEERLALCHDVHREAMQAKIRGITVADLCREVLQMAASGLSAQARLDAEGRSEEIFLEPLAELVGAGVCPAERVRDRWLGEWNRSIERLVVATAYGPEA